MERVCTRSFLVYQLGMLAYLLDFIAQGEKISKCCRLLVGVSQDGRRMKCSHHQYSALIYKLSVLEGNLEIRRNNTVCRNPAQTYNYFGTYQGNLFPQPGMHASCSSGKGSLLFGGLHFTMFAIYMLCLRESPTAASILSNS